MSSEPYSRRFAGEAERDYLRRGHLLSEQAQMARRSSKQNTSGRFHPLRGWILAVFLLVLPAGAVCRDQIGGWIQKGFDTVASLRGIEPLEVDYHDGAEESADRNTVEAVPDGEDVLQAASGQVWTSQSPVEAVSDSEPIPEDSARRLEQLGVESGRLLRWGGDSGYWRYICRVRPDADAAVTHEFEAIGSTAAEALSAAEAKITGWRQLRVARLQQAYAPGMGQVCVR